MIVRAGTVGGGLMALPGLLAACGGDEKNSADTGSAGTTAPADVSGTVTMLVWQGYDDPKAYTSLTSSKDVTIKAGYLSQNEDIITKMPKGPNGSYDMGTILSGLFPALRDVGIPAEIDSARIENYDDLFAEFKDSPLLPADGKLWGVPFLWGSIALSYNVDEIQPASWYDLLDPKYKGKIALGDDVYSATILGARLAGFSDHATELTASELDKVYAELAKFKDHTRGGITANPYGEFQAMFKRGEIVAAFPDWIPTAVAARSAGTNVDLTVPSEGAFSFVDSWLIAEEANNPDAAYATLNQSLSPAAQAYFAQALSLGVVNEKAVTLLPAELSDAYPYDDLAAQFDAAPVYAAPPSKSDSITTYNDWLKKWEEFKAS
jgi:spermidine/putrescine transport system substrate-binding protein